METSLGKSSAGELLDCSEEPNTFPIGELVGFVELFTFVNFCNPVLALSTKPDK